MTLIKSTFPGVLISFLGYYSMVDLGPSLVFSLITWLVLIGCEK